MENIKTEVKIHETTIHLSNNLITIKAIGGYDKEQAMEIREVIKGIFNEAREDINILVDLNRAGKISSEAREIFRMLSENHKVRKIACSGMHVMARVIAGFVLKISKHGKYRFFSSNEEALKWLNA